jgi:hypothetical protein
MNSYGLIVWGVIVIALVILSPLITIWSLNTLFGLAIAYTFETWAAAGVLSAVVSGGLVSFKK